jgi:hypothetical protein
VVVRKAEHDLLYDLAEAYRRTTKQVAEQAVLEHLTRPPQCAACPFFREMRVAINAPEAV